MASSSSSSSPGTLATFLIAVLAAALGVFGQPYFTTVLDRTKEPILLQEVSSTNINSLPSELQRQISFVTTRFSLIHSSGRVAKKITISANSTQDIPRAAIVIVQNSEEYKLQIQNSRAFNIDIESMRPNSSLVLEVTHSPSTKIEWKTLAEEGVIKNASDIGSDNTSELGSKSSMAIGIALIVLTLIVLVLMIRWASRSLIAFVSVDTPMSDKGRQRLIWILTTFVLWNFIVQTFALNILRFPLVETLYAIGIYFLVTNYKAIRKVLSKISATI